MLLNYHAQTYGVTQSGKTFLALKLLNAQSGLKLFINTKGERTYFKYFDQFNVPLTYIDEILSNPTKFNNKLILFSIDFDTDIQKELNEFCRKVLNYGRNGGFYRINLLIDELQEYLSSSGRSTKGTRYIRGIFLQGLALNIRVLFTCQGWSMIDKNIRNNCEVTIILKQRKQDIEAMMDLGLVPYDVDNNNGRRVCLLNFNRKYKAYIEVGIGGQFAELKQ